VEDVASHCLTPAPGFESATTEIGHLKHISKGMEKNTKNSYMRGILAGAFLVLTVAGGADRCLGVNLIAHWKLDETGSPYADVSTNAIPLVQDTGTTTAGVGLGADGSAAQLQWADPGPATRLAATNAALQTDSFGFSFWVKPSWIGEWDNLLMKEMAFDNSVEGWRRMAWQVHMLGNNGSGAAQVEFIVRGADRMLGDFYGVVTSTNTLPLQSWSDTWVHIAGGYDALTGSLKLFVNGSEFSAAGSAGAYNSDGSALAVGSGRNGDDFVQFAAGAFIDDLQLYDGLLSATDVAFIKNHPGQALGESAPASNRDLIAHWKLDQVAPPFADSSANSIPLLHDADSTVPTSGVGADGLCAGLVFSDPGPSTRLYASNAALQQDSFGFSMWLSPVSLNPDDNLIVKEMAFDGVNPEFTRMAWQLHLLGDDGTGHAPLELIVRGDNRAQGDFFGTAASAASIPLGTETGTWIHLAGGYDAVTGQLRLFVDGVASVSGNNSTGAHNSGGYPLSIGTGKNGTNFQFFAAGAYVDDVQLYSGPLTPAEVDYLRANPGQALAGTTPLRITSFSYDTGTGDASLAFDSIGGTNYTVQVSTGLAGFTGATNLTATAASTSVTLSKALLDSVLGATPRSTLFVRVQKP